MHNPVVNHVKPLERAGTPDTAASRPAEVTGDRRPKGSSALTTTLIISVAVAVLYAVLGFAALGLGRMIGLASPVWPAAGVAFAAATQWGWRAAPGILIGSVTVNVVWLTRLGETGWRAWFVGVLIGIGATLGAAVGARLVHRFVGPVRRLDMPRAVVLTLALGGLLATTVAPTIGVAAQLATGFLTPGQAAIGWLTWWVGDSIGVVAIAPVVLMLLPSQAQNWSGRRWQIAVPSLALLAILTAAIVQNAANERARIEGAVQRLGDHAAADLTSNLARHQEVLTGLRGLVDATDDITAKEFKAYTADVLAGLPNLQALSWNPMVTESDLVSFTQGLRAQPGLENFAVTERDAAGKPRPVSPRPEYVVVAYIEPIATNRNALGFDILSNPVRAAAIAAARDTGRPTATAPIDLVQESDTQKGMLALLPIYRDSADPGSESARRAALRGFAVGVYRLRDLLAETFRGPNWDDVDVTLTDISDSAEPVVIADLPARNPAGRAAEATAPAATTAALDVYGRSWELTVRPTNAAFAGNRGGLTVLLLLGALALTFLLEAFLLVLSGMDSMARRLMSELSSAGRYVASILPRDSEVPVPVSSRYVPSQELGGDIFDHRWLDEDHLLVYLVDVSGHGTAPAMFAVSVHNLLRSGTLDSETLRDPGLVLTELNRLFQMESQAGNFFTIWYGVYQPSTHTLRYAGAGHPPALVLTADGAEPVRLPSGSMPIGVLDDTVFETDTHRLSPGAALLLYSDGVFELVQPDGREWSLEEFIGLCTRTAATPGWTLDNLIGQVRQRSKSGIFDDDCTLVRLTAD